MLTHTDFGWLRKLLLVAGLACAHFGCGEVSDASVNDRGNIHTIAKAHASNPTVAIDGDTETTFVAWIGTQEEQSNVYVSALRKGEKHFSSAVQVNDRNGRAAPHGEAPPQVAVGPEGNVYVLWHYNIPIEGRRFPASNLQFARSVDAGKTFSPAIFVNDDHNSEPSSHNFHAMTVAADGTIYVSWLDGRDRDRSPQVRVARSVDSGVSFEPSVVVADKVCTCCRIALASDAQNRLFVAYRDASENNIRDIAIARSDDRGLSFSTPRVVHDDGWYLEGCPHNGPGLDVDADGNVHVTWYTGSEDHIGVHYAVSEDGGEHFSASFHLNTRFKDTPMRAKVVAKNRHTALVACEVIDDDGAQIYLLGPDFSAGSPKQIEPIAAGSYPNLAQKAGLVALAWLDGDVVKATLVKM